MKISHIPLAALVALITLPASAQVQITDAYARSTGASGAVYLVLTNPDAADDRLLTASTDAAIRAALHSSVTSADGVTSMLALPDGVVIPAAGSHALARGGDHIMLMGLTMPVKDGDTLRLTLTFARAGSVQLDVVVDNARLK